jgi:GDSL-like Lipase/Acylhydrolase family/Domain of unknown function (DUF4815)
MDRRNFLALTGIGGLGISLIPATTFSRNISKETSNAFYKFSGNKITIKSGSFELGYRKITISSEKTFTIDPAEVIEIKNEKLTLSKDKPQSWIKGTKLSEPRAGYINVIYSFVKGSLIITEKPDGEPLQKENDYLVDEIWASVGIGNNSRVTTDTPVYASYKYSHQRIDTISIDDNGVPHLYKGLSSKVSPAPPVIPEEHTIICTIYRPFHSTDLSDIHILPVVLPIIGFTSAGTTLGRIPKALKKLKKKKLKIVCWGDSITVGADVEKNEAWANLFIHTLREKYPKAKIEFENHSIGGSKSVQWIFDGDYPDIEQKLPPSICSFQNQVLKSKPDLIVMEFLNDHVLKSSAWEKYYPFILNELKKTDAEWIIVSPSFRMPQTFDLSYLKREDDRDYVKFLRKFTQEHKIALADASNRWSNLYKQGIPYFSCFNNGYNHPNAFGHKIFVEEIMKCFN